MLLESMLVRVMKMIRITEVKLSLDEALNYELEITNIKKYLKNRYFITNINDLIIFKKAIDARKKNSINFVYTVDFSVEDEKRLFRLKDKHISYTPNLNYPNIPSGKKILNHRPLIVGFGPSGIFSAWLLAKRGYKPIVFEMGFDIDSRDEKFHNFITSRKFEKGSSIQFGEGGAGTYSDGKLTTSISDLRCRLVLENLVNHGADPEIMYVNKPHVGTDKLKEVIKSIRKEIIDFGGEIRFNCQLTNFLIENNQLIGIEINNSEVIKTNVVLLGIGHSSRETFELINSKGFNLMRKPFAVGLRIEHPQILINESQYGSFYNHPSLKAADYKLSYHDLSGRSAYTFCMCPGGYVMCGTSEIGGVVTNGMSESKRDNINANSALLVNITTEDFQSDSVLAGMYFQKHLEQIAYDSGGKNYNAPAQLVGDFLKERVSDRLGTVIPSYKPGITFVDFNKLLPKFITNTMKNALRDFDNKIKGFAMEDAILTGIETRSSSPIRIVRNENYESNIQGVFPMGEGSGYAGGIMSSAVDGIKTAEEIIKRFKPF